MCGGEGIDKAKCFGRRRAIDEHGGCSRVDRRARGARHFRRRHQSRIGTGREGDPGRQSRPHPFLDGHDRFHGMRESLAKQQITTAVGKHFGKLAMFVTRVAAR